MSREIKFRAWDKERKEMRQVQLMDWSDWWVSTGHTWERENALQYGERNSFKNEETDRHILMQYTGLKDKAGVEIYEGDLVTSNWYDYEEPNSTTTGEIIYCGGSCAYRIWDEENKLLTDIDGHGCYSWDIEVIGNIWDNTDLVGR